MNDEWDVGTDAEIEDRMIRSFESREEARQRVVDALLREIGFRALVESNTRPRDLRWFRGLFGMRIG